MRPFLGRGYGFRSKMIRFGIALDGRGAGDDPSPAPLLFSASIAIKKHWVEMISILSCIRTYCGVEPTVRSLSAHH